MNSNKKSRSYSRFLLGTVIVSVAAVTALGQYSDSLQINLVERQVRDRIITDLGGSGHLVLFDNNAVVSPSNYARQNRITGSGRYRQNTSRWRAFNYEGLFNLRSGQVADVSYYFTDDNSYQPREQVRAAFRWSGNVDDLAQIRVSGYVATVNDVSGRPTYGVNYNFDRALPRHPVNVSLRKLSGRESVTVLEQPASWNNFSAVIEIRDKSRGADFYEFELDWDNETVRRPLSVSPRSGQMYWEGNVDDVTQVRIQGRSASYRTVTGQNPTGMRADFDSALPRRAVNVTLRKLDGRDSVRLIEQPTQFNGFTAVVEISDRERGSSRYSFQLNWIHDGSDSGVQMTWRGSVDDVARITINGQSAAARVVSGQALSGVNFKFNEPLPRQNVEVRVRKLDGRGSVAVVQQPDRLNSFSTIIEIRDPDRGRDNYSFDLSW